MRLRNVPLFLRHPRALGSRLYRALYDRRHPGEPWIAIGAIHFLEQALPAGARVLEWGSGRSTIWYAQRCASLTSVEHDPAWRDKIAADLASAGRANATLRYVPMDPAKENGLVHRGEDAPAYVRVAESFADASLDLVVVDGQYRLSCAIAAQPKLRSGGLLLVDDEQTFPQLRQGLIPASWPVVSQSRSGLARTTIWRKP